MPRRVLGIGICLKFKRSAKEPVFVLEHDVVWATPLKWAISVAVTGFLLVAAQSAVAISTGVFKDHELAFTVTRNGKPIGSHVYTFNRDGRRVQVDIRTNIDFRLLSVSIYRFKHESHEVWVGDRLIRMVSNTNDNGDPVKLEVRADGAVLKVGNRKESVAVDANAIPASLWNRVVVERKRLLDTVNGAVLTTKVKDLGEETLTVDGETVPARRYRLSGDYKRDLWYDARDGKLVRVRFDAADGSEVEYVLTHSSKAGQDAQNSAS